MQGRSLGLLRRHVFILSSFHVLVARRPLFKCLRLTLVLALDAELKVLLLLLLLIESNHCLLLTSEFEACIFGRRYQLRLLNLTRVVTLFAVAICKAFLGKFALCRRTLVRYRCPVILAFSTIVPLGTI